MTRGNGATAHDKQLAWRCKFCGSRLLNVEDRGTTISIKSRDFFVWVGHPAWIRMPCRRCGALNYTEDKDHPAIKSNA